MSRGSRYARGDKAWGHCERCGDKKLLKSLAYDGQYPDLQVCEDCWDEKHPQEWLPGVYDPITLYDPTGDLDDANSGDADTGEDIAPTCSGQPSFNTGCDASDSGFAHNALIDLAAADTYQVSIDTTVMLPWDTSSSGDVCIYIETGIATDVFTAHDIDWAAQGSEPTTKINLLQKVTAVVGARVYIGTEGTGSCNIGDPTTIAVLMGQYIALDGDDGGPSIIRSDRDQAVWTQANINADGQGDLDTDAFQVAWCQSGTGAAQLGYWFCAGWDTSASEYSRLLRNETQNADQGMWEDISWHLNSSQIASGRGIRAMDANGGTVIVCGDGPMIERSTDFGDHWTDLAPSFPAIPAAGIWGNVHHITGNVWVAHTLNQSAFYGTYRSDDDGATWTQLQQPTTTVRDIWEDATTGTIAVTGGANRVFYSEDGGSSWTQATGISGSTVMGRIRSNALGTVWVCNQIGDRIFYSTDDAQTWQVAIEPSGVQFNQLEFDGGDGSANPGIGFIAAGHLTADGTPVVYTSANGITWEERTVTSGLGDTNPFGIGLNPNEDFAAERLVNPRTLFYDSMDTSISQWTVVGTPVYSTADKKYGAGSYDNGSDGNAYRTNYSYILDPAELYNLQPLAATGFTVEFWANLDTFNNKFGWFLKWNDLTGDMFPQENPASWGFMLWNSGNPRVWLSSGGALDAQLASTPLWTGDSAWHHLALCSNGTWINFYVDGSWESQVAASAWGAGTGSHAAPALILGAGGNVNDNADLAGHIDDLLITTEVRYTTEGSFQPPNFAKYADVRGNDTDGYT